MESIDIKKAYLFLKSYAYHENLNLFLKQRVAAFEFGQFDDSMQIIANVLSDENWERNLVFNQWLQAIDYHLLPKAVARTEDVAQKSHNDNNGLFITNVRDSNNYQVSKVNYFINAPVELHIIEILWCITVGHVLDNELSDDCYGNRMHQAAKPTFDELDTGKSNQLFKRYIEQYNQWRDQAIDTAIEISKANNDVALLSLDLQSYFYHVDLDFEQIIAHIKLFLSDDPNQLAIAFKLTKILEKIFKQYNQKIQNRLSQTHNNCKSKQGLPIGFASASIIANWYLTKFDNSVAEEVRPAYYARYVDDIIMVFKRPKLNADNPIENFIDHYLSNLLIKNDDKKSYSITVDKNLLPIQKEKLILQYFDKDHSRAGLEVFKQELDERSSAFKFLPSDHIDKELGKFAYDILYDGSANKLRSVVGLAENETELAKYLSSHITAHRLCKLDKKDIVLPELKNFFRGQNALQFFRLWEKVYQYALVIKKYSFIGEFHRYLNDEVQRISCITSSSNRVGKTFTEELHRDMSLYNSLSLGISVGLLDVNEPSNNDIFDVNSDRSDQVFLKQKPKLNAIIELNSEIHKFSWGFRISNLIRHHLVAWPLANYSDFSGDLTDESEFISGSTRALSERKLEFSPRFIHFEEWQLFGIPNCLTKNKNLHEWFQTSLDEYKSRSFGDDFPIKSDSLTNSNIVKTGYTIGEHKKSETIKLAIANLIVNTNDITAALRKDKKPNVSFARQENLYHILNSTIKEKTDILVMPEVAIPVSWLPFMVAFARRNQIAIVFGLEHWVVNDVAYNLTIEALPFKVSNKYKSCAVIARLKNHYAPNELSLLDALRLKAGNELIKPKSYYHKVNWRGVSFATYNCFELSDITHRVLFKSEIDLLIACVWNKDTNYYQHILESAVRDLHCYTVQSNTSEYGGSCVLRPTKTENKTMLYVKGGDNSCVLTTNIDIAKLREFQFKSTPSESDSFKHLPPGFDCDLVLKR